MTDLWTHIVADFSNLGSPATLAAFSQVILIDVMLAADNAIVVGALAAGLTPALRRRVILIGMVGALVLRILFAVMITQLMQLVGLVFAGGLLLLWVAWKMWREFAQDASDTEHRPGGAAPRNFMQAALSVTIADLSMSLDNVLAVAGAARAHPGILIVGLVLSVALMGLAANFLALMIERYRWLVLVGLAIILYVASRMIHDGWFDPATGIVSFWH
ncbi:YjbE family integral membrane protein [Sphingobium sp. B1D7B]|uniref:TerC family protein n=1 Tax=Sphingobium sp. B1D7B TaxID=2940578 RepID=UPI00222446B8|nr:TerC family protein [Sphingobium sp. B1D7B]MCW2406872.1 YjbE family integral membrane protein [Sphingobium sp. B1D7B]